MSINPLIKNIPPSEIRTIFDAARKLEESGKKIDRLDVGQPLNPIPSFLKEKALEIASIDSLYRYPPSRGTDELRNSISEKLLARDLLKFSPESEILITAGAAEAVWLSLQASLMTGDHFLVVEPAWPHYRKIGAILGLESSSADMNMTTGKLNREILLSQIKKNTKMIIVADPANPSGLQLDYEDWRFLIDQVSSKNILLMVDRIYQEFDFRAPQTSPPLTEILDQLIYINGFSKSYSMTGLRVGYLACHKNLMDAVLKVHQYAIVGVNHMAQKLALECLLSPHAKTHLESQRLDYKNRMSHFLKLSKEMNLQCTPSTGSLYTLLSCGKTQATPELALRLLENFSVAAVPGVFFGNASANYLRISFGSLLVENVDPVLQKLKAFFKTEKLGAYE